MSQKLEIQTTAQKYMTMNENVKKKGGEKTEKDERKMKKTKKTKTRN